MEVHGPWYMLQVRGQLTGLGSLLPRCGFQTVRFGGEHFYPLNNPNSPEYSSYSDIMNKKGHLLVI